MPPAAKKAAADRQGNRSRFVYLVETEGDQGSKCSISGRNITVFSSIEKIKEKFYNCRIGEWIDASAMIIDDETTAVAWITKKQIN